MLEASGKRGLGKLVRRNTVFQWKAAGWSPRLTSKHSRMLPGSGEQGAGQRGTAAEGLLLLVSFVSLRAKELSLAPEGSPKVFLWR